MLLHRLLLAALCWTAVVGVAPPTTKATERPIKILNESGSKVEIYWIHPQTGALSLMSTPNVLNGASFNLNSFIGHEFEIRELPSSKTGVCKGTEQTCRTNYLSVTENSEQSKSTTNHQQRCSILLSLMSSSSSCYIEQGF